ncbi:hypothetical protein Tco_1238033 [Tanacetum coccineum]
MHLFYQPYRHEFQLTKDHPLEQVIGEPSRPVNQLRTDAEMCIYALSVSIMEPRNVKKATNDAGWIEAMQDELLQFKWLDLCELVPYPDNIKPLTLKWSGYEAGMSGACTTGRYKSFTVYQMDVKTAFLHGSLKEEVYVKVGTEGMAQPTEKHLKEIMQDVRTPAEAFNSGGIQFLGENLVIWSSKRQDCIVLSTVEAEYVSLSTCCAQVLWMRTQLINYGFHFDKIHIYCDLKSTIAISCNPIQHLRTKHIIVRCHFIKEHVEKGTIVLYFVKTDYQLGDIFNKALPLDRFNYLVCRLGMRSLSPKKLERLAKS